MTTLAPTASRHSSHDATASATWPNDHLVGRASALTIGTLIFLLSDAFSFAALLLSYLVLRLHAVPWWPADEPPLGTSFAAILTLLLALSSLTMTRATKAARGGNAGQARRLLLVTAIAGLLFLVGQGYEYGALVAGRPHPLPLGHSHRATTFYVVTGFHGLHVLAGIILLGIARGRVGRSAITPRAVDVVTSVGLFWQFVDLVWILVFGLIYLWPAQVGA